MKKLLLGAVVGGLVVFLWGMVSWMVLPWHKSTMQAFANEQAVALAMQANAPKAGV